MDFVLKQAPTLRERQTSSSSLRVDEEYLATKGQSKDNV